jgi:hypothetical protein
LLMCIICALYLSQLRALYLNGKFISSPLRPSSLHQHHYCLTHLSILNMPWAHHTENAGPTNNQPSAGRSGVPSNKVKAISWYQILFLIIVQSG